MSPACKPEGEQCSRGSPAAQRGCSIPPLRLAAHVRYPGGDEWRRSGNAGGHARTFADSDGPTLYPPDRRTSGASDAKAGGVQCSQTNGSIRRKRREPATNSATVTSSATTTTGRMVLKRLEARVGIEPTHKGFADLSLTTWVPRHPKQKT